MAECICHYNDDLLPVRAGCEAQHHRVISTTGALRDEAAKRIESLRAALREAEDTRRIQDDALLKVSKAWREQWGRAEALGRALGGLADISYMEHDCGADTVAKRAYDDARALAGEPRAEGRR